MKDAVLEKSIKLEKDVNSCFGFDVSTATDGYYDKFHPYLFIYQLLSATSRRIPTMRRILKKSFLNSMHHAEDQLSA